MTLISRFLCALLVWQQLFCSVSQVPWLFPDHLCFNSIILDPQPINEIMQWCVVCPGGFYINKKYYSQSFLTIFVKKNQIFINNIPFKDAQVILNPKEGHFFCNAKNYDGTCVIKKEKNELRVSAVNWGQSYAAMQERLHDGFVHMRRAKKQVQRKDNILYHVRVLLAEHKRSDGACLWNISSPAGFGILDGNGHEQKRFYNMRDINIIGKNGQFFINDMRYPSNKLLIVPREGHISFDGRDYHGNFIITYDDQSCYLINSIDLEDYVFSVLRTESWPGWPLEVNKVCAIASRTYVVGVIANSRKSKLPYHVKNTTQHQTYSGIHPDQTLRQAVQETHGVFLAYDNKPIVAMFDACCGGIIPAHVKGVNFNHAPYLARDYACTFCTKARGYRWNATVSDQQATKILMAELPQLKQVKEISVAHKDKAGVVQDVYVKASGIAQGATTFKGKQFYTLFKPLGLRSYHFSIKRAKNNYILSGKGIGHHMGLCQWGAREMVDKGYDYKKILSFYYPSTSLMRFY